MADSKHRHLMLAFANRLSPPVKKARELIQAGSLGKLYGASIHYVADQARLAGKEYQQSWFASKSRAGGGHLLWLGIHYVDTVQHITGQRIQQVCGFARNVGGQPLDVEDAAAMAFTFGNGMVGTLHSGYYLDRGKQCLVTVWGSNGWLQWCRRNLVAVVFNDSRSPARSAVVYPQSSRRPRLHAVCRTGGGSGKGS